MLGLGEVTEAVVAVYDTQAVRAELGLEAVYYGDPNLIPKQPSLSIVPDSIEHNPDASAFLAVDEALIYLVIYHGPFQDKRSTLKECLQLTASVGDKILVDKTLGGLLVTSWISRTDGGVGQSGDALLLFTRLTWHGKARTQY